MTMNGGGENNKLERILEANEYAKTIDLMAFYIKINALNALFLAIRSKEQLLGYIVVTEEFNRFTEEVTLFVEKLGSIIFKIVSDISNQLKIANRIRLLSKTKNRMEISDDFTDSQERIYAVFQDNEKRISALNEEIESRLALINKLIHQNERLILRGDMLAMQAKIEGAYSQSSKDVFRSVAEQFQEHISKVRDSLQHLRKMLSIDLIKSGK